MWRKMGVVGLVLGMMSVGGAGVANAKLICVKNAGEDRLGVRAGHSMYWLDGHQTRCFRTDNRTAIIQNDEVSSCTERDVAIDLSLHACLIANAQSGVCIPELETRPLADECRSG